MSRRQDFKDMAVRVVEIDAASAVAAVDLAVGARARPAAVADAFRLDPVEDRVEFGFADHESIMMRLELAALVKIEGQPVIDLNRGEVRVRPLVLEPEDPG